MILQPGQILNQRYRVDQFIGSGGMAEVYRVWDEQRAAFLALKLLHTDLGEDIIFMRRFHKEAQNLQRLHHPNIVGFYELVETGRLSFFLMDFVDGYTLRSEIYQRKSPFASTRILEILRPVCSALFYAHNQGVIHCDVKPANIMIESTGKVLLSDFGISRLADAATTATAFSTAGTPAYMSPEMVQGLPPTPATDIYALGIILFELLTGGERPFTGDKAQISGNTDQKVRWEQVRQPPPSPRIYNPQVSAELEAVVFRCLEKDPARRFATTQELIKALEIAFGAQTSPTEAGTMITPPATPSLGATVRGEEPVPLAPVTPPQPGVPSTAATIKGEEAVPLAPITPSQPYEAAQMSATLPAVPPKQPDMIATPGRPESAQPRQFPAWLAIAGGALVVIALAVIVIALSRNGLPLAPLPTATLFETRVPATAAPTAILATLTINPPTPAPTKAVSPIPPATLPPAAKVTSVKVGLVTDTGGVNDKSFNQSAWAGVQKAMAEFGRDSRWEARYIESKQPTDYEKNIDQLLTENYDVIITVGFLMGDATAIKARQYLDDPRVRFAIIDNDYVPTPGSKYCDDKVKDCYVDGNMKNITSLMFQEDQVGFLAGVLAAGMSKTGTVCSVAGMEIPPVVRFVTGFQTGAKWFKPATRTLNVYIPSFTDPAKGKETALSMIGQGCDVIFGVGGNTGNGGLQAAKEKGLMAIGVDVDQYLTYPEVKEVLLSSAAKNVDVAVYEYLKTIRAATYKAGVVTANLQNGGVGLAPFHDWENKIPAIVKAKIEEATNGLKSGNLKTGYVP